MPTNTRRVLIVVMLMMFTFSGHFNRISMSVAGTERLMDEYHFSEIQMGWIYTAYLICYTVFMIPGGWFIDRFGTRLSLGSMTLGAAALVALTGCLGLMPLGAMALAAFLLVRTPLGFVSVPLHPGCARSVSNWIPVRHRSAVNGLVTAAALLGIASTYYVFGALIDAIRWPMAFVTAGALTALLGIAWFALAEDRPREDSRTPLTGTSTRASSGSARVTETAGWTELLRNRSLLLLTASYASVGYFQYLFFYWIEYYFKHVLKYDTDQSRLYATIPNLAMAVGMFLGGGLSDRLINRLGPRLGRAIVPASGLLFSAALLLLGLAAENPRWIVTFFALSMGATGLGEGCMWTTAVELGGRRGGTAAAIFNTGGNFGGLLAPIVTPLFSGYFGWKSGLALSSVVCVVGAAMWIGIDPAQNSEKLAAEAP